MRITDKMYHFAKISCAQKSNIFRKYQALFLVKMRTNNVDKRKV